MILPRDGREFLTFTTSDSSGGSLEVSMDSGGSWSALEVLTPTSARCLVAGPDASGNPTGTIVVGLGTHEVLLRFTKGDEVVIRDAPEWLTVA